MHYLFVLDELNRFAPKGHTDPITQLVETVAAELRSRGVILLGAQQQASLVSPRVVENASVRVLGRTGGHELRQDIFSFLPEELRDYVEQLGASDKVLHLPSFRQPMHVRVPRPPWAMRKQEASTEPPDFLRERGAAAVPQRRPPPAARVPTTSCPEMRLLHTGDWHLGARLGNQDRLPDQFGRLEEICRYLDEKEVDVLLVAGDVFDEHRSEALARIIARLARLLKPRIEAGMWAVFIAGNHDREHVFPLIRGLQDLVTAESSSRVVFTERPAWCRSRARSGEQVQLMLLPYPTPTRYDLPDRTAGPALTPSGRGWPRPCASASDELTREARLEPGVPMVLCGHFLVRGVREGFYQLSEQEDVPVEPGRPARLRLHRAGPHPQAADGGRSPHPLLRQPGAHGPGRGGDRKMVLLADVGREGLREPAGAAA